MADAALLNGSGWIQPERHGSGEGCKTEELQQLFAPAIKNVSPGAESHHVKGPTDIGLKLKLMPRSHIFITFDTFHFKCNYLI